MGYCYFIVLMLYCLSAVVQPHNISYLQYKHPQYISTAGNITIKVHSVYSVTNINPPYNYGMSYNIPFHAHIVGYLSNHNVHGLPADHHDVHMEFPDNHISDTPVKAAQILLIQQLQCNCLTPVLPNFRSPERLQLQCPQVNEISKVQ